MTTEQAQAQASEANGLLKLVTDPAVIQSLDSVKQSVTKTSKAIKDFVDAVAAVDGISEVFPTVETVASGVQWLFDHARIPKPETVEMKNRFQYFKRTSIQLICERLKLATPKTDTFDLLASLDRLIAKAKAKDAQNPLIAKIEALRASAAIEEATEEATEQAPIS